MEFTIDQTIFEKYPTITIAAIFIPKLDNSCAATPEVLALLHEETQQIQQNFDLETVSSVPFISRWRDIYRSFGAKPSDYRSSIENMIRMPLKGREIGHINTLTDIYNYISLHYKLPVGGEDVSKMSGPLRLTFATESEAPVQLLGDQEPESPFPGEVIYKDSIGTICRCWNWREGARTMLTKETTSAIIVIETTNEEEAKKLPEAIEIITKLVTTYCHGENISHTLLTRDHQSHQF